MVKISNATSKTFVLNQLIRLKPSRSYGKRVVGSILFVQTEIICNHYKTFWRNGRANQQNPLAPEIRGRKKRSYVLLRACCRRTGRRSLRYIVRVHRKKSIMI